ncbi:class A beta-lactamase-related serine hydrolase [Micromonospora sp. WMMD1102]|uniref:serine hydrolase n=1 Tax=Micromonospora sp. WMMD1102 TaxID=3016105 RepID=UPI002414F32A|nr:serine hydrolase [Micromonospora sp. WMMD1102]MDG4788593.1 class A beta-lactamase-related serine hydrolase [Micromonospora sp. WMMD1102]
MSWDEIDAELAAVPGTVSVYAGRLGRRPGYTRLPDAPHYAASTMKVAVLAALHRAAEAGKLELDAPVPVRNEFDSARPGADRFSCAPDYDNDEQVWARLGGTAPLRWLAERMIVRSSNLATNLVLGQVGLPAVAEVWADSGARHSRTERGIEDFAARDAGLDNRVTAADLAGLFGGIARSRLGSPAACAAMLDVLLAQERTEDLAAGLPPGTRIAHKNGWVRGVRHSAGVVFPDDAPPYTVVVCTSVPPPTGDRATEVRATGERATDAGATSTGSTDGGTAGEDLDGRARRLIARVSALVWAARHRLGTVD